MPIPGQPGLFRDGFTQDVVITDGPTLGEMASPRELLAVVLMVPVLLYGVSLIFEPRER